MTVPDPIDLFLPEGFKAVTTECRLKIYKYPAHHTWFVTDLWLKRRTSTQLLFKTADGVLPEFRLTLENNERHGSSYLFTRQSFQAPPLREDNNNTNKKRQPHFFFPKMHI